MTKSLFGKGALAVAAAALLWTLVWLVNADPRVPHTFGGRELLLGILVASGGFMLLWSTIIGFLSRIRMWSPAGTFLAAGLPFYILGIWIAFFSSLAMQPLAQLRMFMMVGFGSAAGRMARKKVFPQFSDKDSPSASLPPPTLFPK